MAKQLQRDQLFSLCDESKKDAEELLRQFVETPTVSRPTHAEDIRKGVDLTVETLRRFGSKADVYTVNKGNPVVHGVFGEDNNQAHRHRLQPHGCSAGLQRNRTLGDRPICDDQKRR